MIPRSAYADLAAVRGMRVESTEGGFALVVHGGDAATGYRARLDFSTRNSRRQPVITSRTVRLRANPDVVFSRTEYGFVPVDADY